MTLNFNEGLGNFSVVIIRPFKPNIQNRTNLSAALTDFTWAFGGIFDGELLPPYDRDEGIVALDLSLPIFPIIRDQNRTENNTLFPIRPSGEGIIPITGCAFMYSVISVLSILGFVL